MNSEELRALQAPLKQLYRESAGSASITLSAEGRLGEGVACSVETGRKMIEAGLHPAAGGTGMQVCSGDMLLQALVACAGVTLSAVATALGIDLRGGHLRAEGDLDFRGTLGVAKDVPAGFRAIRLRVIAGYGRLRRSTPQIAGADRAVLRGVSNSAPRSGPQRRLRLSWRAQACSQKALSAN